MVRRCHPKKLRKSRSLSPNTTLPSRLRSSSGVGGGGGGGTMEMAQRVLIDTSKELHGWDEESNSKIPLLLNGRSYSTEGGSTLERQGDCDTIRFQVVVWHLGKLDVLTGSVEMTFRVSIFWNDKSWESLTDDDDVDDDEQSVDTQSSNQVWALHGRRKAYQKELTDFPEQTMDVPPLSIMNVSTFTTIGNAEVEMLNEESRLMRWTCMYRATVVQDNWRVDNFPHDCHQICLKLAILSGRRKGQTWDRTKWKLALATRQDCNCSRATRIPHGLIVDHVRMPGFRFNRQRGLEFKFRSQENGPFELDHLSGRDEEPDQYLEVSVTAVRSSGYYDKNIVPMLLFLNLIACTIVISLDISLVFFRGSMILAISFLEIGIRLSTDNKLPSVGYEIKLQWVLNLFFYALGGLVLESLIVYCFVENEKFSSDIGKQIDWMFSLSTLAFCCTVASIYYYTRNKARKRLLYQEEEVSTRPTTVVESKESSLFD